MERLKLYGDRGKSPLEFYPTLTPAYIIIIIIDSHLMLHDKIKCVILS